MFVDIMRLHIEYDLYGICNHVGGVTGGHYTAFVKNTEK